MLKHSVIVNVRHLLSQLPDCELCQLVQIYQIAFVQIILSKFFVLQKFFNKAHLIFCEHERLSSFSKVIQKAKGIFECLVFNLFRLLCHAYWCMSVSVCILCVLLLLSQYHGYWWLWCPESIALEVGGCFLVGGMSFFILDRVYELKISSIGFFPQGSSVHCWPLPVFFVCVLGLDCLSARPSPIRGLSPCDSWVCLSVSVANWGIWAVQRGLNFIAEHFYFWGLDVETFGILLASLVDHAPQFNLACLQAYVHVSAGHLYWYVSLAELMGWVLFVMHWNGLLYLPQFHL